MTIGETQTEQARLREEIELLRDQVKSDRILLPGRNIKLLFLQQPCEQYPGRIWTQGIPEFSLLEQDGIAPFWSEPPGEYIGQTRCRTEDGGDLACYGMFLNVIGRGKENFYQHAAAIGQLLLAGAVSPGFEFIKELFEFCRLNKRLTWECNEQPDHPETRRRLAWLHDVYEAIGLFLNAQLRSQEQATGAAADDSSKLDDDPKQLVPRVVLKGQAERPEVDGKAVEVLTVARYNVVDALLKAGSDGLTKDRLVKSSGHGSAVNVLKGLAKLSKAWKAVVKLPGSTGKRYALRFK